MGVKAKISGSVVAGFPSPAEQYLEPPLDPNELLVKRPAATYFVRVQNSAGSDPIGGVGSGGVVELQTGKVGLKWIGSSI